MQELSGPLRRLPSDPMPLVADVEFPIVLRGYDRVAVDAYVRETSQLVAELQATRSPEAAIQRALERVGEEVSSVLQRAHETAEEITAQSRSEAETRLDEARREAAEMVADAHARLQHLDADTDRIWAERHRIVEDARELAHQLVALAEAAAERFPAAEEAESQEDTDPVPLYDYAEGEQAAGRATEVTGDDPREATPAEAPGAGAPEEEPSVETTEEAPGAEATVIMPPVRHPQGNVGP